MVRGLSNEAPPESVKKPRTAKPPNLRPSQRQSVLDHRRGLKMAISAHAYVRGNTLKFYEWLESLERGTLPEGPAIWICGDCHVGNLGPVASAEGKVEIEIRDLDQTVRAIIYLTNPHILGKILSWKRNRKPYKKRLYTLPILTTA